MKIKSMGAVIALSIVLPGASQAGTVVISDGTFSDADYAVQTDGSFANTSFSSTGAQIPIGGNPGAFRQITNNAVGRFGGADSEVVNGWHFNTAQPYDPSEGEILSVDYSEDSIFVFGSTQEGRLALRQGGILYRTETSFTTGASNASFSNNQLNGLTAADFEGFFNGNFFPTANPDFTENGGVIEFGFFRRNVSNQNFSIGSGIDNWTVTLTTDSPVIPEPTSVTLLLGFASATAAMRRR